MRIKQVGNLGDRALTVIKNAEASASIPRGTPVVFVMNGTSDGLAVVLPATAGAAKSFNFRAGVATSTLAAGDTGEATQYGVVEYALLTRMTRAASTDSWTSSASVDSGIGLGWDTINNAFLMGASRAGSLVTAADNAVLAASLASSAATASTTADTRTAITNAVRVFVRML